MNRAFRSSTRIAALACAAFLGGFPIASFADRPSYAQSGPGDETISGTIYQVTGRYTLTLEDDRGFIDNVSLHNGTVITPSGLGLGSGQIATMTGHTSGKTFEADEIDVDPSSISSGQAVLPGGDYATAVNGGDYPAYAFGYDPTYSSGVLYFGQTYYGGGGYYAPNGYYPGYGNGYGRGGTYVPPYNGGNPASGNNPEPISRRPVRIGVPPPGYAYPTGGSRIAPPGYHAPVMRGNPAPPAPRSAPAAPSVSRSH